MKKLSKFAGLLAISALLVLGIAGPAQAGTKWSAKKCSNRAAAWILAHPNATPQQGLAYEKKQHRRHGCSIGG